MNRERWKKKGEGDGCRCRCRGFKRPTGRAGGGVAAEFLYDLQLAEADLGGSEVLVHDDHIAGK